MQAFYPAAFDREAGCTEREWLMWLPAALGEVPVRQSPGRAEVDLDEGRLDLSWQVCSPRVIALVRLPRLAVQFRFTNVPDARRHAFMKRFDLHMQRGGG
ncbi:MAG: hypothetical protein JNJ71_14880 [Rubrivivax sp.]|nr:hypothetical protein [Rubrivivax sp.]